MARKKYCLEDFQKIVKEKHNGQCLSAEYKGIHIPMEWKCENLNHPSWFTTPNSILNGTWCPKCAYEKQAKRNRKYSIEYFKDFAVKKHNGQCLSIEYKSVNNLLEWKCSNPDHPSWFALPSKILNGQWCPKCAHEKQAKRNRKYGLEDFQKIAKEKHNGQCLSTEYKGIFIPMEWKCENLNHPSWFTTPNSILNGTWCPKCAREKQAKKNRKYSIEYFKNFAVKKHNGQCLSIEYKSVNNLLEWKCSNPDHPSWFALPNNILNGQWCPKCASESRRKYSIEYFKDFAVKKHNGQCLSTKCINTHTPLEWKCSNPDHPSWFATPDSVIYNGHWCPECSGHNHIYTFDEVKEILGKKGITVLSKEYKNTKGKLLLQCINRHTWWTTFSDVHKKDGNGCPKCRKKNQYLCQGILEVLLNDKFISDYHPEWLRVSNSNRSLELDGYCVDKNIAFEYNGEQHYTQLSYMSLDDFKAIQARDIIKREILQRLGIPLIDIPYFAEKDSLSDKITKIKSILVSQEIFFIDIPNEDIEKIIGYNFLNNGHKEELDLFLSKRNITLLSGIPLTINDLLDVSCNKCGRKWTTSLKRLRRSGCRVCAMRVSDEHKVKLRKYSIEYFKDFAAKKHNGQCLSIEFKSVNDLLEWKCSNPNHPAWFALPNNILKGRWCPKCASESRRKFSIEYFKDFAVKKHNGQCLSMKYEGIKIPIEWKCSNPDHPSWFATPDSVIYNGHWCPKCANERKRKHKYTIEDFKEFAVKNYNGQCLSTESGGTHTPLEWKCGNPDHPSWFAPPHSVMQGHWCPKCGHEKRRKNKT